ncbi:MAG TPA: hypothetical protein VH187_05520 [Scandinavium sp.]|uniref:hypothetical protein n=1 Tax=Scandinavium sp. TaxID=2830653 RepID=UPI002E2F3FAF|nr:hypothetical protein [Scandinavium sp.]HEX4500620.1 hypothetical protein [Scandinavium sp.]
MPEQFQYPENGWSTGTMRKNGDVQRAMELGADIQRRRFGGTDGLGPGEELHHNLNNLPEDWQQINRHPDGGFIVKRGAEKTSMKPGDLRSVTDPGNKYKGLKTQEMYMQGGISDEAVGKQMEEMRKKGKQI